MRRDERGSLTLWCLGLMVACMCFVGLAVDFSRLVAADRGLAAATDASANAAANAIDTEAFRRDGTVRLDPSRARALAADTMGDQAEAPALTDFSVTVTATSVTVRTTMSVKVSLLGLVHPAPLSISATSTASPRRAA